MMMMMMMMMMADELGFQWSLSTASVNPKRDDLCGK